MILLKKFRNLKSSKLLMSNSCDSSIKLLCLELVNHLNTILVLSNSRVSPWIVNSNVYIVLLQSSINITSGTVTSSGENKMDW